MCDKVRSHRHMRVVPLSQLRTTDSFVIEGTKDYGIVDSKKRFVLSLAFKSYLIYRYKTWSIALFTAGSTFLSGALHFKLHAILTGLASTIHVPIKTIVGKKGAVINGRFAFRDEQSGV